MGRSSCWGRPLISAARIFISRLIMDMFSSPGSFDESRTLLFFSGSYHLSCLEVSWVVFLSFFFLGQGYKCLHDDFLRKEEEAHSKFWIKTISPDLSKLLYSILENWRDTWLEIKIHLVMINWVCILEKKVFLLFLLNYIVH